MAATRLVGKLNDACRAALDGVDGVTAYQGRVRMTDTTDFESNIRALTRESQCYAITWVNLCSRLPEDVGRAELTVLLFFNLSKDDSSDCNLMYDKVDEIIVTLAKDDPWAALACQCIECSGERAEDGLQDDVAEWRIVVTLEVPPAC